MFEVLSKTGTKVKIINVTEARANFATVLSDRLASYVITKNNKPQRVIISYEEFEHLQNALGKDVLQNNIKSEESSVSFIQEEPNESFVELPTPAVASVITTEKKRETKTLATREKPNKASQVKGLIQQRMGEALGEDYFGDSEIAAYGLEEEVGPLLSPDLISDELVQEVRETLQQESGQKSGEEVDLLIPVAQKEGGVEPPRAEPEIVAATKGQTPEQAAYFQKYRKLYEGRQVDIASESQTPEPQTPAVIKQEQTRPTPEPNQTQDQTTRATELEPTTLDKPVTEEELPSLEDLLRGLDLDPSGEERENLSDQDINELINRITND